MKFSDFRDKAVDLADDLPGLAKKVTKKVTYFFKKRKKLVVTLIVIYLVFKYLFEDEGQEDQE